MAKSPSAFVSSLRRGNPHKFERDLRLFKELSAYRWIYGLTKKNSWSTQWLDQSRPVALVANVDSNCVKEIFMLTRRTMTRVSHASAFLLVPFLAMSCSSSKDNPSSVKIANGRAAAAGEYPEVVLLQEQSSKGLCSGTFIDANTVITAAHCTMAGKEVNLDTYVIKDLTMKIVKVIDIEKKQFETIATSSVVYRSPKWDEAIRTQMINPFDVAIVKFENYSSPSFAKVASEKPDMGKDVSLVGFGLNYVPNKFAWRIDKTSVGVKRVGDNKVGLLARGLIAVKGTTKTTSADGTNACPSRGDSGGPMFSDGKIVGITSGGGRFPIILDIAMAFYVDLTSEDSRSFLEKFSL